MNKLKGEQAFHNYLDAMSFVRAGQFDQARAVELLPSDRTLVERKIEEAIAQKAESGNKVGGDRSPGDAGSSPAGFNK